MNMKQVALVLYILTLSGAFANPIAADSLYNNFVQPPRSMMV